MATRSKDTEPTELERCRQVIAALSESLRAMTQALDEAKREAEEAKQAAEAARDLASARMSESGDRDIAIGTLFQRIEAMERLLRMASPRRGEQEEGPQTLN